MADNILLSDRTFLWPITGCLPFYGSEAAQQDNWRNSKGSSLGVGSRTNSDDLDGMRSIPQLLRTRNSGAAGTVLPELGALLGRGSFGKVYKGECWRSGRNLLPCSLAALSADAASPAAVFDL